MKYRVFAALFIIMMPAFLPAQVTIGRMEIQTDTVLTSAAKGGRQGIVVDVYDLTVKGYKDRFLTIAVQAVKESTQFIPYDYTMMLADKDVFRIDKLTFEIENNELHRYLGPGSHSIYIVLSVSAQLESENEQLPGGLQYRAVAVNMPNEPPADPFEPERVRAEGILRKLAETDPLYDQVLAFARNHGLIILIRDFGLGTKARELYSWEYCTDKDNPALEKMLSVLIKNWILPADFIGKTGLKALAFVKNISFMDTGVGGGADLADRFLMCGVDPGASEEWIMHILYHEYMHFIDNVMYESGIFDASRWAALNRPGTGYSYSGALDMINDNFSFVNEPHPSPGFLNGYSMADIYQDKAEVFACLLIPSWYKRVKPWLKTDPYLSSKFAYMKNALAKMSPLFTEDFFRRLHE